MQHTHWILTRPLTHPLSPLFALSNSLTPWLILSFTYLFSRPLVNALVLFHQLVLLLTHPFSRSSTRSPAHQSVLSFTHPPTHPFSRSLSRSLAQLPVLALTHPFSCSPIRSLAHPPSRSPAHPPVLSLTHLLSRRPTRSLAHPLVPHKHAGSRERCVWLSTSWRSQAKCSVRQDGFKLNVVLRPQKPQGL